MNPWIVHRWLTSLNVRCLLVENVPEFTSWGPLDENRRPIPNKKGLYFEEWVRSLWGLGYEVQWRLLNAADYGEATTRVRFFLQARRDGQPIVWPEATHAKAGDGSLMEDLPRWRGAREVIDWSNPGRSLLDDPKYKKRPLSENTRRRIARGLKRFGGPLAPLYVRLLDLEDDGDPAIPQEDAGETRAFHGSNRQNTAPRGMDEPTATVTTWGNGGCYLVEPRAEPFMLGQQSGSAPRTTDDPVPTVAAAGAISLLQPIVAEYYGKGESRTVSDPLSVVTTKARHGLASPLLVQMSQTGGNGSYVREVADPLPTITTKNDMCVVTPSASAYVVPNFGEREGQEPRIHDVDEPMPTVTSRGAGSLVSPVLTEAAAEQLRREKIDPRRLVYLDGQPYLLDIRYRMLQNPELGQGDGLLRRGEYLRVRGETSRRSPSR